MVLFRNPQLGKISLHSLPSLTSTEQCLCPVRQPETCTESTSGKGLMSLAFDGQKMVSGCIWYPFSGHLFKKYRSSRPPVAPQSVSSWRATCRGGRYLAELCPATLITLCEDSNSANSRGVDHLPGDPPGRSLPPSIVGWSVRAPNSAGSSHPSSP